MNESSLGYELRREMEALLEPLTRAISDGVLATDDRIALPPGAAAALSVLALGAGYIQSVPVGVRFFPIFAIAGVAGALVPLMGAIK